MKNKSDTIAILGAGNIGCVLAARFSLTNKVYLYKNNKDDLKLYSKNIIVKNSDTNTSYKGNIYKITSNLKEAIRKSKYIFVTFPSFMFEDISKKVVPLLKKGQHLVFFPGSGGAEIFFSKAIDKGVTISGLQRVHCVARFIEKGKSVYENGIRSELKVASIPASYNNDMVLLLSKLFNVKVTPLSNYLSVTLVNSNPLLHTSRLYNIFSKYDSSHVYPENILFYESWNNDSSKLIKKMDEELFVLKEKLLSYGISTEGIESILEHYESKTPEQMTKKINSISSFKGLLSPMIKVEGGYIADLGSRYFKSDFPYGLDIIIQFCELFNVNCKTMKEVSNWYHTFSNDQYTAIKDFYPNVEELVKFYTL